MILLSLCDLLKDFSDEFGCYSGNKGDCKRENDIYDEGEKSEHDGMLLSKDKMRTVWTVPYGSQ